MRIKRFSEWMTLKERLDSYPQRPPHVKESEIWWASLGENIGYEINGKSKLFTRPVLIYKKLSKEFFLVIPLTTSNKVGNWYVHFHFNRIEQIACLQQIRALDAKRLSTKLGQIQKEDFLRIKVAMNRLLN